MTRPVNRFYLIRHGETVANRDRIVMGSRDLPLTEEGVLQAERTRPVVAGLGVDRVFASPMVRARRTAEILVDGTGLPIEFVDDLREQDYGDWEGRPYGSMEKADPQMAARYFADPTSVVIPNGEPFDDFRRRVVDAFESRVRPGSEDARTLIVAHGGTLRILVAHALGLDAPKVFFRLWLDNLSVTTLHEYVPDVFLLKRLNWTVPA